MPLDSTTDLTEFSPTPDRAKDLLAQTFQAY